MGNVASIVGAIINRDCESSHLNTIKLLLIIEAYAHPKFDGLHRLNGFVWNGHLTELLYQERGGDAVASLRTSSKSFRRALEIGDALEKSGSVDRFSPVLLAPLVNLARIHRTLAAKVRTPSIKRREGGESDLYCNRISKIVFEHSNLLTPSLCNARYELAQALERHGRQQEALSLYETASQMARQLEAYRLQAYCHRQMGVLQTQLGDADSASEQFMRSFDLLQGDVLSSEDLADVMEKSFGAMAAQRQAMRQAIKGVRHFDD